LQKYAVSGEMWAIRVSCRLHETWHFGEESFQTITNRQWNLSIAEWSQGYRKPK